MRWVALLALAAVLVFSQQIRDLRMEPAPASNPLQDRGTRWAVVVGISSYEFLPPGAQLRFAHRDAEEFAAFLKTTAGGGIPHDHIRLLANEDATLSEIRAALHNWLPAAAKPEDIVYVFFAGHGIVAERDEGYFVAHDSDPQNLHATGLSFAEVDQTLSNRVRAGLVVLVADACHTGKLGWSSYAPRTTSQAAEPLARIGQGDRSFLKLLASRPSERSFEDERWAGGHGVFTHTLLEGLRGEADRDGDRIVRAAEAIDYISRLVPEQTKAQQHPRVAGTFDGRVALATSSKPPVISAKPITLDVNGPANSSVYVDNAFHGRIRPGGILRIDALTPGTHLFSADFPDGGSLHGNVTLGSIPARVTIGSTASVALRTLRAKVQAGQVVEPGGAWDVYRKGGFPAPEASTAAALISGALEGLGQACVGDYVQSTSVGVKRLMLGRAIQAYERLKVLRPHDNSIETRRLFCAGRLDIAEGRFADAVIELQESIKRDSNFACAYNALGVALGKLHRQKESRQAFETAMTLTPEWALPPYQIAAQLVAAGDWKRAVPYLEKAVQFNPNAVVPRWNLMHVNRLLGKNADVQKQAEQLIRLNPNYAPTYLELGLAHEAARNFAAAAEAYDTYLLLAPNFADSNQVRARSDAVRQKK